MDIWILLPLLISPINLKQALWLENNKKWSMTFKEQVLNDETSQNYWIKKKENMETAALANQSQKSLTSIINEHCLSIR